MIGLSLHLVSSLYVLKNIVSFPLNYQCIDLYYLIQLYGKISKSVCNGHSNNKMQKCEKAPGGGWVCASRKSRFERTGRGQYSWSPANWPRGWSCWRDSERSWGAAFEPQDIASTWPPKGAFYIYQLCHHAGLFPSIFGLIYDTVLFFEHVIISSLKFLVIYK